MRGADGRHVFLAAFVDAAAFAVNAVAMVVVDSRFVDRRLVMHRRQRTHLLFAAGLVFHMLLVNH